MSPPSPMVVELPDHGRVWNSITIDGFIENWEAMTPTEGSDVGFALSFTSVEQFHECCSPKLRAFARKHAIWTLSLSDIQDGAITRRLLATFCIFFNIERIVISDCVVEEALITMPMVLRKTTSSIEHFCLSDMEVLNTVLEEWVSLSKGSLGRKKRHTLKHLKISNLALEPGNRALELLAEVIGNFHGLCLLSLEPKHRRRFRAINIRDLLTKVAGLDRLEVLNLAEMNLGDASFETMDAMFGRKSKLRSSLKVLGLSGCTISHQMVERLTDPPFPKLCCIDFTGSNGVTDLHAALLRSCYEDVEMDAYPKDKDGGSEGKTSSDDNPPGDHGSIGSDEVINLVSPTKGVGENDLTKATDSPCGHHSGKSSDAGNDGEVIDLVSSFLTESDGAGDTEDIWDQSQQVW